MIEQAFEHVETWVFDLDNTLYPPSANLFELIQERMTAWVMSTLQISQAEAEHVRHRYWREHGTTLAGLMRHHQIDPVPYLRDVHDIPMDRLDPDPLLAEHIRALPGRRIVYTNACVPYAERVLTARGLDGVFDAIYGVEDANYHPKPDHAAFQQIFNLDGLQPRAAAMFEDEPRNLSVPHALGMRTVLVSDLRPDDAHIHHHTDDLTSFLRRLTG
ncbi:MAG: pyrimidine 5'-nucleotidase [Pseudomonadota bacterium]